MEQKSANAIEPKQITWSQMASNKCTPFTQNSVLHSISQEIFLLFRKLNFSVFFIHKIISRKIKQNHFCINKSLSVCCEHIITPHWSNFVDYYYSSKFQRLWFHVYLFQLIDSNCEQKLSHYSSINNSHCELSTLKCLFFNEILLFND